MAHITDEELRGLIESGGFVAVRQRMLDGVAENGYVTMDRAPGIMISDHTSAATGLFSAVIEPSGPAGNVNLFPFLLSAKLVGLKVGTKRAFCIFAPRNFIFRLHVYNLFDDTFGPFPTEYHAAEALVNDFQSRGSRLEIVSEIAADSFSRILDREIIDHERRETIKCWSLKHEITAGPATEFYIPRDDKFIYSCSVHEKIIKKYVYASTKMWAKGVLRKEIAFCARCSVCYHLKMLRDLCSLSGFCAQCSIDTVVRTTKCACLTCMTRRWKISQAKEGDHQSITAQKNHPEKTTETRAPHTQGIVPSLQTTPPTQSERRTLRRMWHYS